MRIIIPMAGLGKRMRPHTLSQPKPLIPVAGKPIVYRLVEDIARMCDEKIDEIAFVIGDFGKETEDNLIAIAEKTGAKGSIYYQTEPLGTAHAILCAANALHGHVVVAFADTLFYADFKIDKAQDGIIWTKKIDNPAAFGVVETDENGFVKQFWEKPKTFVSDEAIIGIYYFNNGDYLKSELQYLIDNNISVKGEYQITDALSNMCKKGSRFKTAAVNHWLDCGNKENTVLTNKAILEIGHENGKLVSKEIIQENSVIIPPCYIGKGATIKNSIVGPYVSIGENTIVDSCVITNSIIMNHARVTDANIDFSMVGNFAEYEGNKESLNLGDYSEVK